MGRGEDDAAQATYERGITLLAQEQDDGIRLEILAAARTDLEIAVDNDPSRKDLAEKMKGLLAVAEVPLIGVPGQGPASPSADSSVDNVEITTDRFRLVATYDATASTAVPNSSTCGTSGRKVPTGKDPSSRNWASIK